MVIDAVRSKNIRVYLPTYAHNQSVYTNTRLTRLGPSLSLVDKKKNGGNCAIYARKIHGSSLEMVAAAFLPSNTHINSYFSLSLSLKASHSINNKSGDLSSMRGHTRRKKQKLHLLKQFAFLICTRYTLFSFSGWVDWLLFWTETIIQLLKILFFIFCLFASFRKTVIPTKHLSLCCVGPGCTYRKRSNVYFTKYVTREILSPPFCLY